MRIAYDTNVESQVEWQLMYWPDYSPIKRRKRPRWIPFLLLGLLCGVVFIGSMTAWWGLTAPSADDETKVATKTKLTTVKTGSSSAIPTISSQIRSSATMAPEFVLPDLFDGFLEYSLADYAGRPVIINFWASWCVPCRVEMPALQRAYEEHRDTGLVVLGVNQTFIDDPDAARDFVDELALTFPNARDDTGNISEKHYQVIGLPTSVLISPEGEIVHVQIGQMTDEQVAIFSKRLVAGEDIAP